MNQITGDASFYPPLRKRGRSEPASQVEPSGPCKYPHKYADHIGVMLGLYWDNIKKYRGHLGILEKKMETTILGVSVGPICEYSALQALQGLCCSILSWIRISHVG